MNDDEVAALIAHARSGEVDALGRLLEGQQSLLRQWAEQKLGRVLNQRIAPSDILQMTLLDAYRDFDAFRGSTEAEFIAWLQRILEHNAATAARDHTQAAKRSIRRETPLAEESGLALAARGSSPSRRAARIEEALRLTRALQELPADQREAVRLRHLEGRSLDEIAKRMQRSHTAVAGLIKRGMSTLREHLGNGDSP